MAAPTIPMDPPRALRSALSAGSLQMTVTGSDADGKLFREPAAVLHLRGRDCIYRSKNQVQPDSWLMVEIRGDQRDAETWRAGAQVKSVSRAGPAQDLFQVSVELERAHGAVLIHVEEEEAARDIQAASPPRPLQGPPPPHAAAPDPTPEISPAAPPGPATVPDAADVWITVTPPERPGATADLGYAEVRNENSAASGAAADPCAEADSGLPDLASSVAEVLLPQMAEMIDDGVAAEFERQMSELKATISSEVEKAAQGILSARMAAILEAAVETKMAQYADTVPTIADKVVEQLAGRLAKIPQLEASVDALSKGLTERWSEISRKAAESAQQSVSAKIAVVEGLAKQMIGDLERKLDSRRAEWQGILELSQAAMKESATASQKAQETMRRLREVTEAATPLLDESLRARVEKRSAEFNSKVDRMVVERAAKFMSEIELLLASRIESAERAIQQLAAQLQSSEELLRKQQEHLRELLEATGAQVEQEIRGVLRRLSGTE